MLVRTRLQEIRKMRGVSAADLARRAGVSRQTIYAIEDGSFVPNTTVSLQLARALDVTVEEIFFHRRRRSDRADQGRLACGDQAEAKGNWCGFAV